MRPDELAAELDFLLCRSPAFPGRIAGAVLIANPRAGGFTRKAYARRRHAELELLRTRAASIPPRPVAPPLELALTAEPGHAAEIAAAYIAANRPVTAISSSERQLRLLISAGGDGTSLEVLGALMDLPPEERAGYLVLRLPLGTGNDGSEGRDLETALGRLLGPCRSSPRSAIRVKPAAAGGKAAQWAFNITSVGADAFIADMTNRLKTSFPGDSYKLWVDVASVLYDFRYPPQPMTVAAWSADGKEVRSFERDCLLMAMGSSGRRQYGSNKPILPDDDNVCFISQMSLLRKLVLKGPIQEGRHRGLPEVDLFQADRLRINYGGALLFQADGEVTRLEAIDFPLEMELLPDSYNVIEAIPG
jgi:diacylglycerol kinase family enzyme